VKRSEPVAARAGMVYASMARRRVVRRAPQVAADAAAAKAARPCTQPRAPDGPVRRERGSRLAEAVEARPGDKPTLTHPHHPGRACVCRAGLRSGEPAASAWLADSADGRAAAAQAREGRPLRQRPAAAAAAAAHPAGADGGTAQCSESAGNGVRPEPPAPLPATNGHPAAAPAAPAERPAAVRC